MHKSHVCKVIDVAILLVFSQ